MPNLKPQLHSYFFSSWDNVKILFCSKTPQISCHKSVQDGVTTMHCRASLTLKHGGSPICQRSPCMFQPFLCRVEGRLHIPASSQQPGGKEAIPLELKTQINSWMLLLVMVFYHSNWKVTNTPWKHKDPSLGFQAHIKTGYSGVPFKYQPCKIGSRGDRSIPGSSGAIWQSSKPMRNCPCQKVQEH